MVAGDIVASGVGGGEDQGELQRGAVPAKEGARWTEAGHHGRAACAAGHDLAHVPHVPHVLAGRLHEDLGPDHFERHDKQRRVRYLVAQIEKMGVEVEVKDEAA